MDLGLNRTSDILAKTTNCTIFCVSPGVLPLLFALIFALIASKAYGTNSLVNIEQNWPSTIGGSSFAIRYQGNPPEPLDSPQPCSLCHSDSNNLSQPSVGESGISFGGSGPYFIRTRVGVSAPWNDIMELDNGFLSFSGLSGRNEYCAMQANRLTEAGGSPNNKTARPWVCGIFDVPADPPPPPRNDPPRILSRDAKIAFSENMRD